MNRTMDLKSLNLSLCNKALGESVSFNEGVFLYYLIPDREGNARWLFSSNLEAPLFLKSYNVNSLRSKILYWFFYIGFFTRLLQRFYAIKVYASTEIQDAAFFMGTVGPNRKLIKISKENGAMFFEKIPFGENSFDLVNHECEALKRLNQEIIPFQVPGLSSGGSLKMSDLNHEGISEKLTKEQIWDLSIAISTIPSQKESHPMVADALNTQLNESNQLLCNLSLKGVKYGFAHGDFTPWNIKGNTQVGVFDWEMSGVYPLLYDWFHFYIQNAIMSGVSVEKVQAMIEDLIVFAARQDFVADEGIDAYSQYKAYLIYVYSFYRTVYCKQDALHTQAIHALAVWEGLLETVNLLNGQSARVKTIETVFEVLELHDYAWMKSSGISPSQLSVSSDLDFLILKSDVSMILASFKSNPLVVKMKVKKYSAVYHVEMFLLNGEFLVVDLIFEFKRHFYSYLDAASVLDNTFRNVHGVKVPSSLHDALYMVHFNWLNGVGVSQKYGREFRLLDAGLRSKITAEILRVYNQQIAFGSETSKPSTEIITQGRSAFQNEAFQRPLHLIKSLVNYAFDTIKRKTFYAEPVISFTGVDGAGKSTVLFLIKEELENRFRKEVKVLRHRPSYLPIISALKYGKREAERRTTMSLPRTGGNQSMIGSLLRYSYYLTDYIIGQLFIWFQYSMRGQIVLYDRYVYDFIVDPRRSNLNLPQWVRSLGAFFVSDPNLNVFLYAKTEAILKRKQELSAEDITSLTSAYSTLFEHKSKQVIKKKFVAIENVSIDLTVSTVLGHYRSVA